MQPSLCSNSVNTKHPEEQQGKPQDQTHQTDTPHNQGPTPSMLWLRKGTTTSPTWEKHEQNQMSIIYQCIF